MNYRDLTPAIERDLVRRYQAGDRAAGQDILDAFDGVLWAIARRTVRGHVDFRDAQQTLRVCILEAAARFDDGKGFRLSSYLSKYALGAFMNALLHDSTIVVKRAAYRRARVAVLAGEAVPERTIQQLGMRSTESLDAGPYPLRDKIVDESVSLVEEYADDVRRRKLVEALLASLPKHEAETVRGYYMREDDTTYEELGDEFGMKKQAIHRRLERAMLKMRARVRTIAGNDDAVLWGGRRDPPGDADVPAPVRVRRDGQVIESRLLHVLQRAGDALGADIVVLMQGITERRSTVYAKLRALIDRGLVIEHGDADDRRAKRYRLTDAGLEVLARLDGKSALRSAA